jgi:hypothetical protein
MSWKKEAYKENLPASAITKVCQLITRSLCTCVNCRVTYLQIEELEGELEGLKKERKQKLLHFETLDGLLKKTQNENKDTIKQRDKALQEVICCYNCCCVLCTYTSLYHISINIEFALAHHLLRRTTNHLLKQAYLQLCFQNSHFCLFFLFLPPVEHPPLPFPC